MTPPTGPVFISLPGDILNIEGGIDLGSRHASRYARAALRRSSSSALADRILKAERPVLHRRRRDRQERRPGRGGARSAEVLGCAGLSVDLSLRRALPVRACRATSAARPRPEAGARTLDPYDTLIVLGSDVLRMSVWSEVDPMPDDLRLIQIGLVDWEIGKNYPAEMAMKADVRETMQGADPACCKKKGGTALAERAEERHRRAGEHQLDREARKRLIAARRPRRAQSRSIRDWLTYCAGRDVPKDGILVNEGLTTGRHSPTCLPFATATHVTAMRQAASAGHCRRRSACSSPSRTARSPASPATAARCTRSRRCGPPPTRSCR